MQIVLILLSSGSLGFISYLILRELGILNFPLREKEIEKITLIHFSIFNAIAVYFLYWVLFKEDLLQTQLTIVIFAKVIGLSLLASFIMPFIYAVFIKLAQIAFQKIQQKNNLITNKYKPLFNDLFLPEQYEDTEIIIFDYSNKFIHAGHLERMEYKEGKLYFSLYAAPYHLEYTYEEVIKRFHNDNTDLNRHKIVIDSDRQQKYFLIYDPNKVD
ncbi:hypothetical protein ORD22_05485 [Sporosarcina sp. GW1-11]|uniref:hypothetical protein n=1 Tax=Sporosarcina sp. GW1-11 TaxID=2899126 RepID=UPI00294C5DEE|nr:hypothetical protein [Sporosarcina sp. GW1-11]MDV6377716.1 hypothetical protein [Sporosarcina sp. GW1-11]